MGEEAAIRCDGTDHREMIVGERGTQHRRLTNGRVGTADEGQQIEPGFVYKEDGAAFLARFA